MRVFHVLGYSERFCLETLMKFTPPLIALTLLLASGASRILSAQGMPPTPLLNGATAQFLDLANPDTTAEKISI